MMRHFTASKQCQIIFGFDISYELSFGENQENNNDNLFVIF